jgi:hypothetical protein
MHNPDVWCSNCQQRVQPRRAAGPPSYIVALGLLTFVLAQVASAYWTNLLLMATGALMLRLMADLLLATRACPICGTHALQPAPPTHS